MSISDNSIIDLNSFNGTLLPCLSSQEIRDSACNFRDTESGHYYGSYIPIKTGPVLLSIFYNSPIQGNFHLFIYYNIVLFYFILFYFILFYFILFLIPFLNHIVMIMKDTEIENKHYWSIVQFFTNLIVGKIKINSLGLYLILITSVFHANFYMYF